MALWRMIPIGLCWVSLSLSTAAASCPRPDALGTSRIIEINPAGGLKLGLKSYPQTLALAPGEVVLTFDDGPLPALTGPLLKALRDECVKATFFLVGRNAKDQAALLRRALADGHTLAHHTLTHPAKTLRGLSAQEARAEIFDGMAADDLAVYGQATEHPRVPFFRYPGFADTPEMNALLAQRGIAIFGADLWASDWMEMSPQQTLDLLLKRLAVAGKGIVLLHDNRLRTVKMMPDLLRALKARHYRVVHIVPGSAQAPLEKAPSGWRSETEAIIAKMNKGKW